MVTTDQLEKMAERLSVYDVDQGGWEHEDRGFDFNVSHVQRQLGQNLTDRKDLTDPEVIRKEIAPDSVQYALRFARWSRTHPYGIAPSKRESDRVVQLSRFYEGVPLDRIAIIDVVASLSAALHDKDHGVEKRRLSLVAHEAGRLLVYSADLQAAYYDFDLVQAFDERLMELRERAGIPAPDAN